MTFQVRRAKPEDAQAIANFVSRATGGRVAANASAVMGRLGSKGLWLAQDQTGRIVGLAGWRAEDLVARIDDFLIHPTSLRDTAGKQLLADIEDAARELQCEISLFFIPEQISPASVGFYKSCGYGLIDMDRLPRSWQDAVDEAKEQGRFPLMKRLRQDRVVRPI